MKYSPDLMQKYCLEIAVRVESYSRFYCKLT